MKLTCASLIRKLAKIIVGDYTLEKDPAYKKIVNALIAAGKNDFTRAHAFLYQASQAIRTKEKGYKDKIPALNGIIEIYNRAMKLCEEKNPAAVEALTELVSIFKKTEADINKALYPNQIYRR
jgi:hypothetical protein